MIHIDFPNQALSKGLKTWGNSLALSKDDKIFQPATLELRDHILIPLINKQENDKKTKRRKKKNGFPEAFVLTSGISFIFTEPLTYKMDNASPLPPLYKK